MKLQYKITLLIFVILLVIGLVGATVMLYFHRQNAATQFEESALVLATALHESLEYDMLEANWEHIQDEVISIAAGSLINEVVILSNTQKIYASGESSEIGQTRDDEEIARALATGETVTRVEEQYGQKELCVIFPVKNNPQCYGCHDSETKILGAVEIGLDMSSLDAQTREQTLLLVLIGGLTFIAVGGALTIVLRSAVVNPLATLAAAARRIAQGDFSARADVETKDEVGMVAHTFNEMAQRVEEAIRRSTEFSDTVMSSINDGICIINVDDYRIVGVNRAFLEQLGCKEEEAVGKTCHQTTHHRSEPCTGPNDRCPLLDTVKSGKPSVAEHTHYSADGEGMTVEVSTHPVKDENGEVIQVVHVSRDITERKQAEDSKKELEQRVGERTQQLQQMAAVRGQLLDRLISAQEEERRRVARELHDEAGQALSAITMNLARAIDTLPDEATEAKETLSQSRSLVAQTLADLRKLIYDLRPEVLDQLGLVPALRSYIKSRLEAENIQTRIRFFGLNDRLSPQTEITLFRVIQEAITNIVRHSGASTVNIQVTARNSVVTTTIKDNGKGFEVEAALRAPESWGLRGIRERVAVIGGELKIESEVGKGTRIQFQIPLGGV